MEVGPPQSIFRNGLQTTVSGISQNAGVVSITEKAQVCVRCKSRRRTQVNHRSSVETMKDDVKTRELMLLWDKSSGYLIIG